ncbi:class I SAM-dependent methyltransferase [Planctomycetes bacterium K23_9]|uniref:class I SAM-dependent methyltransferase n=1 Tax=Stieleria marina TaxID=1930275 RepID=UPI0011A2D29C
MPDPLNETSRLRCEEIITSLASQDISVAQTRHINEELGVDLASLVLSSAMLQSKAIAKLGEGRWWITDKSLQQATPWQVARLKASWFGAGDVYDLCCGIGGDAVHLAKDHSVVAVDASDAVCLMVKENLRNHVGGGAVVINGDVLEQSIPGESLIHVDPDRRADDRRSVDPNQYSPAWNDVAKLVGRVRGGAVKLAPAAEAMPVQRDDVHRVWISLAGTVREQCLLFGETVAVFRSRAMATDSLSDVSAVVVRRDGASSVFCPKLPLRNVDPIVSVKEPVDWMVDPDAAIRSAGLTEAFAAEFGLSALGGPEGFLTGQAKCDGVGVDDANAIERFAICERVVWQGSCDDRKLRKELRARDLYPKRIKTRGVSFDPNQMEKKLRQSGDQPCSLWLGRNGKRHYAAMTVGASCKPK